MHLYLQHNQKDQWLSKFNPLEQFKTSCEESFKNITSSSGIELTQLEMATKWFIHGLTGPFGIVTGSGTKSMARLCNSINLTSFDPSLFPSVLIPPPNTLQIVQTDCINCGVCCTLFIRNFLLTQATQWWKVTQDQVLSPCHYYGSRVLDASIIENLPSLPPKLNIAAYLKLIYNLFLEEFFLIIERLHLLYFESNGIVIPQDKLGD